MSDLISRQQAIDATWFEIDRQTILNLPPAQPERIRGRWIEKPHVYGVAYCSLCDYELHTNDTNFCPNCGADMRGEQDDESRSNSNAQTDTRARGMGATDKSSGI